MTRTAPEIRWLALFDRQGPIEVSEYSEDREKRYSHFYWPTVYLLYNPTGDDVAVADLVNLLPARLVPSREGVENRVEILQEVRPDRAVEVFDSFHRLQSGEAGLEERFPVIVRAGEKKYLRITSRYRIVSNGRKIFCNPKTLCRQLIARVLGGSPQASLPVPCPALPFETRIDFVRFRSRSAPQRASFLVPGCRNAEPQRIEERSLTSSGWPGAKSPPPGGPISTWLRGKIREEEGRRQPPR